ncbi:MAG: 3-dehydroquinate synthase [Schaalia hyovaginalis]|uniref:3-dehydroquinate synthase n=1 Tax=Schaalia hyovaginalis TaxID=29316 RepID=UPI0023F839B5|nr:3-dehydroquinate synthase [Schaalia hyovaginalis]MCI7672048.1 3-dehydroquinate synthase [Schaalia hyovaginalis]MDY4492887.1 3-dehydroquinate synthase [Schaalia hyovaginalis]MDY6213291.1 3-dehydroquinate synthase [Schaalia hyovaginalis]
MRGLELPIVLAGLPGSGKSKVGRILAKMLGVEHVDTDDLIVAEAGVPIARIFDEEGEAAFRLREARAVERALSLHAVVSLGGGAVTTPRVRALLADASVVTIDVEHDELLRRVTRKSHRPLLREDPEGALRRLRSEREPYYREVEKLRVPSDSGPAVEVAERIFRMVEGVFTTVPVEGEAPYDVLIGRAIPSRFVREALRPEATRALIVHAPELDGPARALAEDLRAGGLSVHLASHPRGEAAKSLEVVEGLWGLAGELKLGRADAVIAMGGGATTDMAGFVAATWLRGIDFCSLPTTLLAMVDAAVGGKTGINSSAGKNLIGSFHPARRVLCDLEYLTTLPEAEFRAGLGEVVKCGFIADEAILEIIGRADEGALIDPASPEVAELIGRAIGVKAKVVSADLKESGLREILNYGHTFAHAIERCEDYSVRHGEAVAIGCVFAARLAQARGMLTPAEVERHIAAFTKAGLATTYSGAALSDLTDAMLSDKKVRAGALRFVLLEGIGNPRTVRIDPSELALPASRIGVKR